MIYFCRYIFYLLFKSILCLLHLLWIY